MWEGFASFYNEFSLDYMNTASSLLARRLSSDLYMRSILHMQVWEERFLVHTTEYWIISRGHPLREFWDVFLVWSNIGSCHLKSWIICLFIFFLCRHPTRCWPCKNRSKNNSWYNRSYRCALQCWETQKAWKLLSILTSHLAARNISKGAFDTMIFKIIGRKWFERSSIFMFGWILGNLKCPRTLEMWFSSKIIRVWDVSFQLFDVNASKLYVKLPSMFYVFSTPIITQFR